MFCLKAAQGQYIYCTYTVQVHVCTVYMLTSPEFRMYFKILGKTQYLMKNLYSAYLLDKLLLHLIQICSSLFFFTLACILFFKFIINNPTDPSIRIHCCRFFYDWLWFLRRIALAPIRWVYLSHKIRICTFRYPQIGA